MKVKILFLLLSFASFAACNGPGTNNPSSGSNPATTLPESSVMIIKFTNPEYADNPIVSDYADYEHFVLFRGNQCSALYMNSFYGKEIWEFDFPSLDGRSPYIPLTDGWYLVDWTWDNYPYDGKTILTAVTWDTYQGEFMFDKSTPHVSGGVFQKRGIRVDQLITYAYPEGNYPIFDYKVPGHDTIVSLKEFEYFENLTNGRYVSWGYPPYLTIDGDCLCNRVEEMDNLWDLLRQHLVAVIENDDLDNLPAPNMRKLLDGWW